MCHLISDVFEASRGDVCKEDLPVMGQFVPDVFGEVEEADVLRSELLLGTIHGGERRLLLHVFEVCCPGIG